MKYVIDNRCKTQSCPRKRLSRELAAERLANQGEIYSAGSITASNPLPRAEERREKDGRHGAAEKKNAKQRASTPALPRLADGKLHGLQARLPLLHVLMFTPPPLNPPPPLADRRSPPPPPTVLEDAKLDPSPPLSLRLLISEMCSLAPPLDPPAGASRELAIGFGGLLAALDFSSPRAVAPLRPSSAVFVPTRVPSLLPVPVLLPPPPLGVLHALRGVAVALPSERSVSRYPPQLPSLSLPAAAARRLPPPPEDGGNGPCRREAAGGGEL